LTQRAVLHGTWSLDAEGTAERTFFVWAERMAPLPAEPARRTAAARAGIRRHPYAATALEIAHLLEGLTPGNEWRRMPRMTRIAMLPSGARAPVVPSWLMEDEGASEPPTAMTAWRVEGLSVPLLRMLDVLVALPAAVYDTPTLHRLGADLRFWGLAAKFGLELLARERFIPGMKAVDGQMAALWLPVLDTPEDQERFDALVQGMPPACRAVTHERNNGRQPESVLPQAILGGFLGELIDTAVRAWGQQAAERWMAPPPGRRAAAHPQTAWWQALWANEREVKIAPSHQGELTHFYQAWQGWTLRGQREAGDSFRLCLRLEPPEFDEGDGHLVNRSWRLRYFLQAIDDPSLLVPARDVWREQGDVLSYLNRRFDQPQEKLLAGLGMAARLAPAVRRSLKSESPEYAVLSDQEAFTFLRETARLLESAGFGVMVPPWWNKPDARLRVRAKLKGAFEMPSSGMLGVGSLVSYDWELALGDETLTREEFERLAALKTPLVQVRGRWVLLQPDQVEAAIAFWERQRARGEMGLGDALGLALGARTELDGLPVAEVELDDSLTQLLRALQSGDSLDVLDAPEDFHGELRPYQSRGYSWLAFLRRWGFGACLADDMGLGKTIQAISLILYEKKLNPDLPPSLVICPTSLVGNWRREVARFGPALRVMIHHGSGRAEGDEFVNQSRENDLVISTYGLVRRDIDDLARVTWGHVILDEAQNIKNPLTKQARSVRRLNGEHRVALTGTPIENRLSELWSIMSFLNPGYLGSLDSFRRNFAIPIERYQDPEASESLRALVRPFILRRVKTDPKVIQDLPEKFEYKVFCNLTREQATLYEAVVQDAMGELRRAEQSDAGTARMKRRGLILAMLTRLKQICNHPALYLGDGSEIARRSGKMNRLREMLEEILEVGDRALVFTQFAQMGSLLQNHLQQAFDQEVLFLHGGTPQEQRDRMLMRFQDDPHAPSIFVLSLKAGGTGLNLMRANHVFHYDRWWNPAVENQATDRAYRIGQTRDVQVQKFICLGTLEERIDGLIESKRTLAESIVGQGESWLTELSTQELHDLIALRAEAVETE
jgi:SNF2 family DNA or RNA helicase